MNPENFGAVLLLPRLKIQNANAVSSPMTWGFPSPSAFTGFVHALQLRLNANGHDLCLGGVGIVCHAFEPQVFLPPGRRTHVFRLSRNPVDKDGATVAIVEEGRAHLEISLVFTVAGKGLPVNEAKYTALASEILSVAQGMRIAGGSIIHHPERKKYPAQWLVWDHEDHEKCHKVFQALRRRLLPGFALVSREQLLARHLDTMQKSAPDTNALDALLDLCRLNIEPAALDKPDGGSVGQVTWNLRRPYRGWLVPLPIGYAAISPLYAPGEVRNARDDSAPFRFVESVISLGEWVSPHRVPQLEQLLWHHHAQPDAGLYRLQNSYLPLERSHPPA
jgi:CRISPR-associated protein Csy2